MRARAAMISLYKHLIRHVVWFALTVCVGLSQAWAASIHIAVAANFAAPMKKIAQAFERETGHTVVLSAGSTGQLYAQIRNGAPFAVFLSGDDETPARLEAEGLAVRATRFTYATGRLVLWSRQAGRVDRQGEILRGSAFNTLAIANPALAPYGAAAVETLSALGLRDRVAPRLIEGANITQAYQFVASGNAELGFVALSQVMEDGQIKSGSAWLVPANLHSPLRQDAVLLNAGKDNPAASALLSYLRGKSAKAVLDAFGYTP